MKNLRNSALILLILLVGLFFILKDSTITRRISNIFIDNIQGKTLNKNFATKIKSGNLSTDYTIDEALNDINKLGLNTINIPVVINVEDLTSSTMTVDEESKKRSIALLKALKGKNINIILEPYPWISNGSKYETDWNPIDINAFFWNWKNNVLTVIIEDIAIPYDVDALNIGTSFNHMEYAEGYWCDTVDYVRKYYKGLVTYRTSWWVTAHWDLDTVKNYKSKLNNNLFSKLDFISIAAYFELTNNNTNSSENLVRSLQSTQIFDRKQNVKEEIKNFYDKWNKPIFFGELGFPRTTKASIQPWNPFQSNTINSEEQANCFEAYRRTFEEDSWILGFSVFAIGNHGDDKLYYPSDESTAVIKNWYGNIK